MDLAESNSEKASKIDERLSSIWPRFFEVIRSLTKKQKSALNAIYTAHPPMTYKQAAKKAKISKDSFQDRVRGAVKKIGTALPELENLASPSTASKSKGTNLLYSGLFCKASAKQVYPLYRIAPHTGQKTLIPARQRPPGLNKIAPNRIAVCAWSIIATPMPDIMYTEFFLGLVPEGHIQRKK